MENLRLELRRELTGETPDRAVVDGLIVFGDGMHQTNDAMLYCLWADTGRPVWQLPVPGRLVHLEGSPTIDGGRVYIGGGEAGILCVDLKRMTLDGKDMNLAAARALIDKRWAEMAARYGLDGGVTRASGGTTAGGILWTE